MANTNTVNTIGGADYNIIQISTQDGNVVNVTKSPSNNIIEITSLGAPGPIGPKGDPGSGFPFIPDNSNNGIAQITGSLQVSGGVIFRGKGNSNIYTDTYNVGYYVTTTRPVTGSGLIISSSNLLSNHFNFLKIGDTELVSYKSGAVQDFIVHVPQGFQVSTGEDIGGLGTLFQHNKNEFEVDILDSGGSGFYNEELLITSGRVKITNKLLTPSITASIISASSGVTGSLFGTASWAQSASQADSSIFSIASLIAQSSTNSDKIKLADATVDTDYGFVLKDGSGAGYFDLYQDSQVDTPAWNPSTNTFKASIISSSQITGSLLGTSSWATNALIALSAPNYVLNSQTSSFVQNSQTSSFVQNSQTSSFVQATGSAIISGSLTLTGSLNTNGDIFLKNLPNTSKNFVVLYDNSTGQLTYTASTAFGGGGGGGGSTNPGGVDKSIQFNDGGFFSGSNSLIFDKNSNILSLTGSLIVSGGDLIHNNFKVITENLTGSFVQNSQTSSFVQNSQTSSMLAPYVLTSVTSSMLAPYTLNSQTSSFVRNTQTSSMLEPYLLMSLTSSMLEPYLLTSLTSSLVRNNQTSSMLEPYLLTSQTSSLVRNDQTNSLASLGVIGNTILSNSLTLTGSFNQTGSSNIFLKGLIGQTTSTTHVVTFNNTTGQLFITGASAFGGGGGGGGTPGSVSNTIQYNNDGAFDGSNNFTFNGTNTVSLTGSLIVSGGDLTYNNSKVITENLTGSMLVPYLLTSLTNSFIKDSQTGSMLAPYLLTSLTSSLVRNSQTSSMTVYKANRVEITTIDSTTAGSYRLNFSTGDQIYNHTSNLSYVPTLDLLNYVGTFRISGSQIITGSLGVSGSMTLSGGNLIGTSSWAISSSRAISSSFASVASISSTATTATTATTSTFVTVTGVSDNTRYTLVLNNGTNNSIIRSTHNNLTFIPGTSVSGGLLRLTGSFDVLSGSITAPIISASSFTGSLFGTASWALNVVGGGGGGGFTPSLTTDLTAQNITASANISASGILSIGGVPNVSASIASLNAGVGTLQTVTANGASTTIPITASIISASQFTGSLFGTSSWAVSSSRAISSSFAITASHALNSVGGFTPSLTTDLPARNITASVISASSGFTGSLFGTASWSTNARTASFLPNTSYNITASRAVISSFVDVLNQALILTGSLSQTNGSVTLKGLIDQTTSTSHVVTFDNSTGQLYITGASAFGGGGGGSGTPGGAFNTIQYNSAGAFGGSNNFTFNGTNTVSLTGSLNISGSITTTDTISADDFVLTGTGVPTITSDTNLNLSASNAVVIQSPVLRLRPTTTASVAAIVQNGDIIYDSEQNKFFGRANGVWVAFH